MVFSKLKKTIKNSKVLTKGICSLSQYLKPKSNFVAYSLYVNGEYEKAYNKISKFGSLSLILEYRVNHSNKELLNGLFFDKSEEIRERVFSLPYDMIGDYLVSSSFNNEILCEHSERTRLKSFYIQLIVGYLSGFRYRGIKNSPKLLKAIFLADRFIFNKFGVKNYYLSQVIDSDLNFYTNDFFDSKEDFSGIINCTKDYDVNHKKYIVKSIINYLGSVKKVEYFESIFGDVRYIFKNSEILSLISSTQSSYLYLNYFDKLKGFKLKYWIEFYFFTENYYQVVRVVKLLKLFNFDRMLNDSLYLTFLSLIEAEPDFAVSYIEYRKSKGMHIGSYSVLCQLFLGNVKNAEEERGKIETSLQAHIDNYYTAFSSSDFNNSKSILVVAEQGVADEVRWARLYSSIDKLGKEISVVCDPRFFQLFRDSFKNIKFLPHERLFRKPSGMTVFDFHEHNLPSNKKNYDFVMSASSLFLIDDIDVKTTESGYIIPPLSTDKRSCKEVKVGLLWSSSLAVGLRGERYGIPKTTYKRLIKGLSCAELKVSFYCLQSPLGESDIRFCKESGVNLVNAVDLYNDFYSASSFLNELDYVIGPSSLVNELAAAVGTTFLHIANAPEIAMMRNGKLSEFNVTDQLSNCTRTVTPKGGYIGRSREEINDDIIDEIVIDILSLIDEENY